MIFEEDHVRDDDVGICERGFALVPRCGVLVPIREGVNVQRKARHVTLKSHFRAGNRRSHMTVERDDRDANGYGVIGHSAPSPRKACRW